MRCSLFSACCGRLSFTSAASLSLLFPSAPNYRPCHYQYTQPLHSQCHSYRFMSGGNNNNDNDDGNHNSNTEHVSAMAVRPSRTALPPSDFPERSFLKCIEKEIMDETLRLDKEEGPPTPPSGWEMYHAPGTSLFYARRWWLPPTPVATTQLQEGAEARGKDEERVSMLEQHTIRVRLTSRDASLDPECDIRGEHFPFSLFVQRVRSDQAGASASRIEKMEEEERDLYEDSIEVRADVVDGELVIDNVVFHGTFRPPKATAKTATAIRGGDKAVHTSPLHQPGGGGGGEDMGETAEVVHYTNICGGYPGPNLDETEEEVLDGVQAWLAERCIDDQFGEFIGQYSVWVEQQEYERWLRQLRDFVAA